jgi:hypothetical protein
MVKSTGAEGKEATVKSLRPILGSAGAIVLLAGLAAGAAGQEASPEPSPAVSPAPLEAEPVTEPLPVADYWGEWSLHKKASRERVRWAVDNAKNARSKKVGFYRTLLKWISRPVHVGRDGFVDRGVRRLAISDNGRMLLRIPRNAGCREAGLGLVPLTVQGKGEMAVVAATPEFDWVGEAVYCHPRGGRKLLGNAGGPGVTHVWDYDPAADVIPLGAECYWRTKTGSPKDCEAFWRGTPAPAEDADAPVEEAAGPVEEAAASPDAEEG